MDSSRLLVCLGLLLVAPTRAEAQRAPAPIQAAALEAPPDSKLLRTAIRAENVPLLVAIADAPNATRVVQGKAERALAKLSVERLNGRWLTFEDFKRAVGFVRTAGGAWLPSDRADLLAAIKAFKAWTPVQDALLRQSRAVVVGMHKNHVIALAGVPERVDRVRTRTAARTMVVWELWVMENGRKVYFANGRVFAKA